MRINWNWLTDHTFHHSSIGLSSVHWDFPVNVLSVMVLKSTFQRTTLKYSRRSRAEVAAWYTALHLLNRWSWVWTPVQPSTNVRGDFYKYVDWKGSATMLASIQSAGVTPEVNLEDNTGKKACKKQSTLSLKPQGRCHQKSKTGVPVTPRKWLMSSKKSVEMYSRRTLNFPQSFWQPWMTLRLF